jgi:spermidine/putrescine ABC transporter ATP-binding subunit
MPPPAEHIVELRNVSKRYGENAALDDFSLAVRRGEFLTLLGPSGSGKTTLLRLVAGFELPQAGQVLIDGRDATDLPPYHRNVNTVFQQYALFPHLTVFRNIAFGLEQKKSSRQEIRRRVEAIMEMVELPGKEGRYPHQLSGGEKQRVALARALVLEPPVLLLDEPLGALDQKLRQQMQVELKRLRQRLGITFIFVTHDQQEALVMSDRIAVINHGRLEQVGTGEEIYERPRTHFVAEFMGVENFFDAHCVAHNPEGSRFQSASGISLWASDAAGLPLDSPVTLAVRPECLRLSRVPPVASGCPLNLMEGEVVESIYEGGSRRWVVRIASGQRVTVRDSQTESQPDGDVAGSKIYIAWDAAKSLVFPRDEGAKP